MFYSKKEWSTGTAKLMLGDAFSGVPSLFKKNSSHGGAQFQLGCSMESGGGSLILPICGFNN